MPYQGRDALWAYGADQDVQCFPVVIVSYDRIVARADQAEKYVLDKTLRGLMITGAILLGVVVLVVAAALASSRYVTVPSRISPRRPRSLPPANMRRAWTFARAMSSRSWARSSTTSARSSRSVSG